MIDYKPFWETLKQSEETTYTLVTRHRISGATIDKLRKNKPVNTTTLDGLCGIFELHFTDRNAVAMCGWIYLFCVNM